ncbi:VOC family protein [Mycobacterium sp. CBMA293]|uniref:VOC family protein n=1 Tax=unclassified Mycolicibacterium TaxID=2636767 RepID=UPI0012DC3C7E|nr:MULTISPECIES: VOC family protein [unclassified Mycolicibacterium]MUL48275.1 VOC family protein [Mycolicibacterium sp. CBMA 360]MUL57558.1 VOC family protein [Mycolicibacterium sp. CBMA 335]MUL70598.1 VOC family protein [Mycolicibacterium sp. CBMA 311]MUL92646.1 VOC family protein [Mycolicibacterium sp. CBMA 230]MUM08341.1 glyoxalase [Mycolicibacterium sp. CBMA 213]
MALINPRALHHLRITVTDLARSRAFYEGVLGFTVVAESPGDPADPVVRNDPDQLYGGVLFQTEGLLFGLRPVADPDDRFVSERVGLDHLSFLVDSVGELSAVAERLEEAGIEHGEVKELNNFGLSILSFSDPDGIHLELTAAL